MVLEFDHRDPHEKDLDVSTLLKRYYSWERLSKEIAKCDVRCANCHMRKTASQRGYWKTLRR